MSNPNWSDERTGDAGDGGELREAAGELKAAAAAWTALDTPGVDA